MASCVQPSHNQLIILEPLDASTFRVTIIACAFSLVRLFTPRLTLFPCAAGKDTNLRYHARHCEDTPVHKYRKALVLPNVKRARIMSDAFWAAAYAISTQGIAQVSPAALQ